MKKHIWFIFGLGIFIAFSSCSTPLNSHLSDRYNEKSINICKEILNSPESANKVMVIGRLSLLYDSVNVTGRSKITFKGIGRYYWLDSTNYFSFFVDKGNEVITEWLHYKDKRKNLDGLYKTTFSEGSKVVYIGDIQVHWVDTPNETNKLYIQGIGITLSEKEGRFEFDFKIEDRSDSVRSFLKSQFQLEDGIEVKLLE